MPETMVQVTLPEMGESVTEGSIVEWRKKVGEYVTEGDPLVEVTTDKVDVEVPASASGVLTQILAGEGQTVAIGAPLAEIDTAKTNGAPSAPAPSAATPANAAPRIVAVTLPEMGESVTEGSIVEWQKRVGDYVDDGDPIVNVTTDKVDVEVPATASGVIVKLVAAEGATVAVGAPLAEIDANAARPAAAGNGAKAAPSGGPSVPHGPSIPHDDTPLKSGAVATPQAKRAAKKLGIDVACVRGSGPDGLILRDDVIAQAPSLPKAAASPADSVDRQPATDATRR